MPTATLTSKGQMTIPKDVRDDLGLNIGDRIEVIVQPDGTIRLIPLKVRLDDLRGILGKPKRPLPGKALDRAIRDAWGSRWRRRARSSR